MKHVTLGVAGAVAFIGFALASDDGGGPVRYHSHNGMTVIVHSSMHHKNVATGTNTLDEQRTFTCRSASGCVIVTDASEKESNTVGTMLCTLIDGAEGAPGCWNGSGSGNNTSINFANEQQKVGPGSHTVETVLRSDNHLGQILGWQVRYTIYERKGPAD